MYPSNSSTDRICIEYSEIFVSCYDLEVTDVYKLKLWPAIVNNVNVFRVRNHWTQENYLLDWDSEPVMLLEVC